jgi:signal recognition particle subunit SRP54
VVGKPIAFASTGEKLADFDLFHPDRLAGRILGMGDVLTLIDKAKEAFDQDEAEAAAARMLEGQFTLEDFLEQMQQVKKMGPIGNLIGMMPGMPKELKNTEIDDKEVGRIEAIIRSMTTDERQRPELVDGSRRLRIANGSGTSTGEVNQLLKQFKDVQKMMKRFGGGGVVKRKNKKGKVKKGRAKARQMLPPGMELPDFGDLGDLSGLGGKGPGSPAGGGGGLKLPGLD